ncbi:MAG: hypothetical protein OXG55_05545 [bacterium]|nr:hypothetical protein [bacterium]
MAYVTQRRERIERRVRDWVVLCCDQSVGSPQSAEVVAAAAARAARVLVLEPSVSSGGIVLRRRGNRRYTLTVTGESILPVQTTRRQATARWTIEKLERIAQLTSRKRAVSVSILDVATEGHALHLPHRVTASLLATYRHSEQATELEAEIRAILGRGGCRWELELDWDRPPMPETPGGTELLAELNRAGEPHGIAFGRETSSNAVDAAAGLVGAGAGCLRTGGLGAGRPDHDAGARRGRGPHVRPRRVVTRPEPRHDQRLQELPQRAPPRPSRHDGAQLAGGLRLRGGVLRPPECRRGAPAGRPPGLRRIQGQRVAGDPDAPRADSPAWPTRAATVPPPDRPDERLSSQRRLCPGLDSGRGSVRQPHLRPLPMSLSLLLSVPHAGTEVPAEVAAYCALTPEQIVADGDEAPLRSTPSPPRWPPTSPPTSSEPSST